MLGWMLENIGTWHWISQMDGSSGMMRYEILCGGSYYNQTAFFGESGKIGRFCDTCRARLLEMTLPVGSRINSFIPQEPERVSGLEFDVPAPPPSENEKITSITWKFGIRHRTFTKEQIEAAKTTMTDIGERIRLETERKLKETLGAKCTCPEWYWNGVNNRDGLSHHASCDLADDVIDTDLDDAAIRFSLLELDEE